MTTGVSVRTLVRSRRFWGGLLLGVFFLYLAFRQVDFALVGESLLRANPALLLLACILYFVEVYLRGLRWSYLLRPLRHVQTNRLFPIMIMGYMSNNLLPMRAGELVRAWLVGTRAGVSRSAALATIAIERVFDGITMLLALVAVMPFLPVPDWLWVTAGLGAAAFAAGLAFCVALVWRGEAAVQVLHRALFFLPSGLRSRTAQLFAYFLEGLQVLRQRREVLVALGLSLVVWPMAATNYYIISQSIGLDIPWWGLLLVVCVIALVSSIPSAPGYLGTFELSAMATMGLPGLAVPATLAATMTLLVRSVLFFPVIFVGLAVLWQSKWTLGAVFDEAKNVRKSPTATSSQSSS